MSDNEEQRGFHPVVRHRGKTGSGKKNKYDRLDEEQEDFHLDFDPTIDLDLDSRLRNSRVRDYDPIYEESETSDVMGPTTSRFPRDNRFVQSSSVEIVPVEGIRVYHDSETYEGPSSRKPKQVKVLKVTEKPKAYVKPNSSHGSADETDAFESRSRSMNRSRAKRSKSENMRSKQSLLRKLEKREE